MNTPVPTKGNLINMKKSIALARLGFELMEKKHNILIHELMSLVERAKSIRGSIDDTYTEAYFALQMANISNGIIEYIAEAVPPDDSVRVTWRSVMGCELPSVTIGDIPPKLNYGFQNTDSYADMAYISFDKVKRMTAELAWVENSIYRLTNAIRKTQARANALKNIIIPRYESDIHFISARLEEKELEEFSRMKVIKARKMK